MLAKPPCRTTGDALGELVDDEAVANAVTSLGFRRSLVAKEDGLGGIDL